MRYFLIILLLLVTLGLYGQERGAGTPTTEPDALGTWIYVDSSNEVFYFWDGNSWETFSNHDAVTLGGAYDYLTISGQVITRNQIDLTTDVTGSTDGLTTTNPWGGTATIGAALDSAFANIGGGSDNLGNHIMTQNLETGVYYVSYDSGNGGIGLESDNDIRFYSDAGDNYARFEYDATNSHAETVIGLNAGITEKYSLSVKDEYGYTSSGSTGGIGISTTYSALRSAGSSSATFIGMNFNHVSKDSLAPDQSTGLNISVDHAANDPLGNLDDMSVANGNKITVTNSGGGAITTAYGINVLLQETGSGSITNAYSIYAAGPTGDIGTYYGARFLGSASATTTVNLLRLGQADNGGTKYNLYADGTAPNYFQGNVGIGIQGNSEKLRIVGDMRLSGAFKDKDGDVGGSGQVLSSTVGATDWIDNVASADNGLSVTSGVVSIGASSGTYTATLNNNRQVTLDGNDLLFVDNSGTSIGTVFFTSTDTDSGLSQDVPGRVSIKSDPSVKPQLSLFPITSGATTSTVTSQIDLWGHQTMFGTRKASIKQVGNSQNSLVFQVNNSTTETDAMIIRYDGNVGIGTSLASIASEPSQTLDVNGTMRLRDQLYDENNSVGSPGQVLSTTASGVDWIDVAGGGGISSLLPRDTPDSTLTGDVKVIGYATYLGSTYKGIEVTGSNDTLSIQFAPYALQTYPASTFDHETDFIMGIDASASPDQPRRITSQNYLGGGVSIQTDTTIDWSGNMFERVKFNAFGLTSKGINFSNGISGGRYTLMFTQVSGDDTYTFADNIHYPQGDTVESIYISENLVMELMYDDTNYIWTNHEQYVRVEDVTPATSTTITIDAKHRSGTFIIDMTSASTASTITFTLNNPGRGFYTFHFENTGSTNSIDFPTTFLIADGTTLDAGSTYDIDATDEIMTGYFDGTNLNFPK